MATADEPVTTTTTEYKAYNGYMPIHTPDLTEAVVYAQTGMGGGYVEKIEQTTTITVVFRDKGY